MIMGMWPMERGITDPKTGRFGLASMITGHFGAIYAKK